LTGLERYIGFTHIVATANGTAKTLGLAFGVNHRYAFDLYLEHQLHRRFDFGLGGVLQDFEGHSVSVVNTKGKTKRFGRSIGRRDNVRKAYVTLKPGQELNLSGEVA